MILYSTDLPSRLHLWLAIWFVLLSRGETVGMENNVAAVLSQFRYVSWVFYSMMIYDLRRNCVIMTHVILTDNFVLGLGYNNNMSWWDFLFIYNVNDNFFLTANNLIAINLVETIRTTQLLSAAT